MDIKTWNETLSESVKYYTFEIWELNHMSGSNVIYTRVQ